MAYLAGKFLAVERVIGAGAAAEIVAAGAIRSHAVVTVINFAIAFKLSVHFLAGMAACAGHTGLTEMNIGFNILMFTQEFVAYPAAVASRAVARQRGGCIEDMAVDEAAANGCGLADVAVAARSVAAGAVVAKHLLKGGMFISIFGIAAQVDLCPVTFLGCVQAFGCRSNDLCVAAGTN